MMMRKLLTILAAITLLSSCGTLKKAKTEKTKSISTEVITKATETKTVTEKADTTVTTKADSVKATGKLDVIQKGDTIKAETWTTSVEVYLDGNTGDVVAVAKTKPQHIPVTIDRTTVSKTETEKVDKSETKTASKTLDKERKSGSITYLWGVISAFLLLIILYFVYRWLRSYF